MKRLVPIIIFFSTIYSINICAQIDRTIPEMTPPSPEVGNLGQYGDVPINNYTGIPNIEVPLYEIDFDGLQIPISLSYHAGGIHVSQEATWVGLGWSLSADPVITRQINGLCDITEDKVVTPHLIGYAYTDTELPTFPVLESDLIDKIHSHLGNYLDTNIGSGRIGWDTEPDIFRVNIFGESVKFILTQKALNNGKIEGKLLNPDKRFKIEYNEEDQSFYIVNDRGFQFFFTIKEYSVTASGSSFGPGGEDYIFRDENPNRIRVIEGFDRKIITGWHLEKVISPKKDTLNFNYSERVRIADQPVFHNRERSVACYLTDLGGHIYNPAYNETYSASITGHDIVYLSGISSDMFQIDFKTSDRVDLTVAGTAPYYTIFDKVLGSSLDRKPQKLDQMVIRDNSGDQVRQIDLGYSYFNEVHLIDNNPQEYVRLKLNDVLVNNELFRKFDYLNSEELPGKLSKSVDFWGFYNGKSNSSRIPSYQGTAYCEAEPANGQQTPFEKPMYFSGANREADFNYGKNGLLAKIIYPTKGYTEFQYEGNSIRMEDDQTKLIDYGFEEYRFREYETIEIMSDSESYPTVSETLTIRKPTNISGGIDIACGSQFNEGTVGSHQKCDIALSDMNSGKVYFELINADTGEVMDSKNWLKLCGYSCDLSETGIISGGVIHITEPGNYKFKVTGLKEIGNMYDEDDGVYPQDPDYGKQYFFAVRLKMNIPKSALYPAYDKEVGGARIKSLANYDNNGELLTRKEYRYEETFEGEHYSSGILMTPLAYHRYEVETHGTEGCPGMGAHTARIKFLYNYSDSQIHMSGSAQGNHIGYSRVEEIFTDNIGQSDVGKIVYHFANTESEYVRDKDNMHTFFDFYGYPHYFPLAPPQYSYEERNGDLLLQEYYNNSQNLLKAISFTYDFHNYFPPRSIASGGKLYLTKRTLFNCEKTPGRHSFSPYQYFPYPIKNEVTPLIAVTETDFLDGKSISTKTDYTYNEVYLPATITSTTSEENKKTKIHNYYPLDAEVSAMPFVNELTDQNRIVKPVRSITFIDSTMLEQVDEHYGSFYNGNIIASSELRVKKGTSEDYQIIKYEKYDNKGNVLQYRKSDGETVSLVWSYQKEYPVAKIENATFVQVASALGRSEATLQNFEVSSIPDLDALRDALPNSQVTTYTYNPLIGISTVTDPRGVTMYYDYDDFNRLEFIRDETRRLLEEYKYHYKN